MMCGVVEFSEALKNVWCGATKVSGRQIICERERASEEEGDGVVVADVRVVQIKELEVRVVVQLVAKPDGAPVTEILHVLYAGAARDVLRGDLGLATLSRRTAREQQSDNRAARRHPPRDL